MTIIAWASIYGATTVAVTAGDSGAVRLEAGDEMGLRNVTIGLEDVPIDSLKAAFAEIIRLREEADARDV